MVLTVTLNPAVDQTVSLRHLKLGDVNRVRDSQLDPAGKGVNVSRMAHRLGSPTIAFGFLAGEVGLIAEKALDDERVPHRFVRVSGQTRLNVTVNDEAADTVTSLLGPGPIITVADLTRIGEVLRSSLQAGRVLVLAGNVPRGVHHDVYETYVRLAQAEGVKTIVDADGDALRFGIAARPCLIKPNVAEAERLLGRALPDVPAIVAAARELVTCGVSTVVISMGARGAVCAQGARVWMAIPPKVKRRSTVGSGDSLVAGLAVALARDRDITEGLREGTAAGAATAMTPGTSLGATEEIRALVPGVRIEELS